MRREYHKSPTEILWERRHPLSHPNRSGWAPPWGQRGSTSRGQRQLKGGLLGWRNRFYSKLSCQNNVLFRLLILQSSCSSLNRLTAQIYYKYQKRLGRGEPEKREIAASEGGLLRFVMRVMSSGLTSLLHSKSMLIYGALQSFLLQ